MMPCRARDIMTASTRASSAISSSAFVRAATTFLPPRIKRGTKYVRAGVVVTDLVKKGSQAYLDPFVPVTDQRDLAGLLGKVTDRFGAGAVGLGRAGMQTPPAWAMKRNMLSRRATTVWDELPVAMAS